MNDAADGTAAPGKLDAAVQKAILRRLQACYPDAAGDDFKAGLSDIPGDILGANAVYLCQHGLITADIIHDIGSCLDFDNPAITERGLDFLSDDGGLGARLAVVTIRLHDDAVRDLIIAQLERSTAPGDVRTNVARMIRALPARSLETIAMHALAAGLAAAPDLAATLRTWLRSG